VVVVVVVGAAVVVVVVGATVVVVVVVVGAVVVVTETILDKGPKSPLPSSTLTLYVYVVNSLRFSCKYCTWVDGEFSELLLGT
jgi:butyrate kinase